MAARTPWSWWMTPDRRSSWSGWWELWDEWSGRWPGWTWVLATSFDLAEQEMRIVLRFSCANDYDICSRWFIEILVSDPTSATQSPVSQMPTYCLSIYCGMGGIVLEPYCWHCERYWYCVFRKASSLPSSPLAQTTQHNTQCAQCQFLTGCTMTRFWKNFTNGPNFDAN